MLQFHQRIVLHRLQAAVTRHTTAVVIDLDNILRYANINFLSNQIVRNRVFVPTIRDAVIVGDLGHRPNGRLKRNCWQRKHMYCVLAMARMRNWRYHLHNFFHDTVTALNSSHQHQQVERQLLCLLFRMLLILRIEEPIMRLQKHELLVPKEA